MGTPSFKGTQLLWLTVCPSKMGLLLQERICFLRSKVFPIRVDPYWERIQKWKIAESSFPESLPIHLKIACLRYVVKSAAYIIKKKIRRIKMVKFLQLKFYLFLNPECIPITNVLLLLFWNFYATIYYLS